VRPVERRVVMGDVFLVTQLGDFNGRKRQIKPSLVLSWWCVPKRITVVAVAFPSFQFNLGQGLEERIWNRQLAFVCTEFARATRFGGRWRWMHWRF
jgi:hypothetical protein